MNLSPPNPDSLLLNICQHISGYREERHQGELEYCEGSVFIGKVGLDIGPKCHRGRLGRRKWHNIPARKNSASQAQRWGGLHLCRKQWGVRAVGEEVAIGRCGRSSWTAGKGRIPEVSAGEAEKPGFDLAGNRGHFLLFIRGVMRSEQWFRKINKATVFRIDWKWERQAQFLQKAEPRLWRNSVQPFASVLHLLSLLLSLYQAQPCPPPSSFPLQQPFSLGSVIDSLLKVSGDRSKGHFINSASLCEA